MTVRFDVIAGVGIGAAILGVLAWVTRPVKPASVAGKSKSDALRELFRKHPEAFIIAHHGDSTVLGAAPSTDNLEGLFSVEFERIPMPVLPTAQQLRSIQA